MTLLALIKTLISLLILLSLLHVIKVSKALIREFAKKKPKKEKGDDVGRNDNNDSSGD